jgi:proline iminopeptidase
LAHEAGRYFPEGWSRFRGAVPQDERDDLVAAYDRRINHHPDPIVRTQAAYDWCAWEDALLSLDGRPYQGSRTRSKAGLICFARLVTHYFAYAAFLPDDYLLEHLDRLAAIPAVLVHGRFDLAGPPDVPWLVAQRWPSADLHLVLSGHSGNDDMSKPISEAYAAGKPS